MNIKKIIIYFTSVFFIIFVSKAKDTLLETISSDKNYSKFYELIKKANYEKIFSEEHKFKKIVYIPNNEAFETIPKRLSQLLWSERGSNLAKKIVKTHFYSDSIKTVFMDPRKKVTVIERLELNDELIRIYSNSDLFVKDMVQKGNFVKEKQFTIIPVSCVMFIQPSYNDNRLNDLQKDESLITSCCLLTDQEAIDIVDNYNF